MNMNDLAAAAEQDNQDTIETNEPIESTENTSIPSRPDYIPENYWDSEKNEANYKQAFDDLRKSNERVEGLRKKLSSGEHKKSEDYDSILDDRELSESQLAETKKYIEIAKQHGLTKAQAEGLINDIAKGAQSSQDEIKEQSREEIIAELGQDAGIIIKGLQNYAIQQVNNGNWSQEDQNAFDSMVYDAKSAKLMAQLIQQQQDGVNLSHSGSQSNGMSMDEYYAGMEKVYQLEKQNEIAEANNLRKELEFKGRHLFN